MGTFLKVVGIIVLVFGVIFIVLSVIGMGNFLGMLTSSYPLPSPGEENFPTMPTPPVMGGLAWMGGIGGIVGGFGIIVLGVTLFCIGAIYNDVKVLRGR